MNSDQACHHYPTYEASWQALDYSSKWAQVVANRKRQQRAKPDSVLSNDTQAPKDIVLPTPRQDLIDDALPKATVESKENNDFPFINLAVKSDNSNRDESDFGRGTHWVSHRINPKRMKHIQGYAPSSTPLPRGLDNADIITHWPNHLHGHVLLDVMRDYSAKEIEEMCPATDIHRNMIATRFKYAKQKLDPEYKPRARAAGVTKPRDKTKAGGKGGNGKGKKMGKVKASAIEAALEETESRENSAGDNSKQPGSYGIARHEGYRQVNWRNPFDD